MEIETMCPPVALMPAPPSIATPRGRIVEGVEVVTGADVYAAAAANLEELERLTLAIGSLEQWRAEACPE